MITAVVVSQLSGRARQRTLEALSRQGDLERLYALSRSLLLSQSDAAAPVGDRACHCRSVRAAGVSPSTIISPARRSGPARWSGPSSRVTCATWPGRRRRYRTVAMPWSPPSGSEARPSAAWRSSDGPLSDTVLQSVANLAAIGLERARGQAATTRAEAARQSGELRAAVLDALAHEFKTPLTSMKVAASALQLEHSRNGPRDRELVEIVDEDLDASAGARHRRHSDASHRCRRLRRAPRSPAASATSSRRRCGSSTARLQGHTVTTTCSRPISPSTPTGTCCGWRCGSCSTTR